MLKHGTDFVRERFGVGLCMSYIPLTLKPVRRPKTHLKYSQENFKKNKIQQYFFSQWMLKRVINHISLSSECILFSFPQTHKHNRRTYSECKSNFRFLLCMKELKTGINVFSHKQSTYDLKHIGLKLPLIKWLTNKQSLCQRVHLRTAGNHTTVRHTSEVSRYNRPYPARNRQRPRMFKRFH